MPKKILEGKIVSSKTAKTAIVEVEKISAHPVYKKRLRRTTNFAAHWEGEKIEEGEKVKIEETRPISKTKRWRIAAIWKEGKWVESKFSNVSKVSNDSNERNGRGGKGKSAKSATKSARSAKNRRSSASKRK